MNDDINDDQLRSLFAYYQWVITSETATEKLKERLEALLAEIHESRLDRVLKWRRETPGVFDASRLLK